MHAADYCNLLISREYVCHVNYCITVIELRQVFLCYNFSAMIERANRFKYVAAIVLLIGMTVFVAFQDEHAAQDGATQSANADKSVPLTKDEAGHTKGNVGNAERHAPSWYGFFRWPDGTTVWAIIMTLLAIAEQTRQTRRSAEATEKTLRHMQEASIQWVELEPDGTIVKTETGQPIPPTVVVISPRWKIINKTTLPLKLETAKVQIAREEGWRTYVFDFRMEPPLPPHQTGRDSAIMAPLRLNTSETAEFLKDGIELSIAIDVIFRGTGGRQEQHFGGMYVCKLGSLELNDTIGKGPQKEYIEEYGGPSTIVEEKGFVYLEDDQSPEQT